MNCTPIQQALLILAGFVPGCVLATVVIIISIYQKLHARRFHITKGSEPWKAWNQYKRKD